MAESPAFINQLQYTNVETYGQQLFFFGLWGSQKRQELSGHEMCDKLTNKNCWQLKAVTFSITT